MNCQVIQKYGPNALRRKDKYDPVLDELNRLEQLQVINKNGKRFVELNPKLLED